MPKTRALISADDIARRVAELAREIDERLPPGPLSVVGVLRGAFIFMADLVRAIPREMTCDFLGVRSYGDATVSSGVVEITSDLAAPVAGRHVLLVEDIADTGLTHKADGPHHVRRFKVTADGSSISGGDVFATCPVGLYDGFRVDVHGNLWLSAGDGVHCHARDGSLLGKILIPETVANVCFGGPKLNRLFICATTSLYSIFLNTRPRPRA